MEREGEIQIERQRDTETGWDSAVHVSELTLRHTRDVQSQAGVNHSLLPAVSWTWTEAEGQTHTTTTCIYRAP